MSELKKLNSELRAVLTAGDGTVSNGRGGSRPDSTATVNATLSSSNRDVARRLLKLSEELKQAKLSNLRQNRELKLLREEKKHLQRRVKQQDQTLRRADEDLVAAQTAARQRELELLRDMEIDEATSKQPSNVVSSRIMEASRMDSSPGITLSGTSGSRSPISHRDPDAEEALLSRRASDNQTISQQMLQISNLEEQLRRTRSQMEDQREEIEKLRSQASCTASSFHRRAC